MSDSHQESDSETQYRANVQPKADKNKFQPKFRKDNKLWLTRVPHQGSIQVIVQERRATEVSGTGGWEYQLKDPDTNLSIPGWFAQSLLTRVSG